MLLGFVTLVGLRAGVTVVSAAALASPSVKLDSATFTGTSSGSVSKFLGIPFAQPPVGDLRFRLPQPIPSYNGSYTVTSFRPACPQQAIELPILTGLAQDVVDYVANSIFGIVFPDAEDCLTINVVKPTSATATSKLPVVAWIFGGGFELGSPAMYDGATIVQRSIDLREPVIYVSMNYRVTGFGFMAGKEIKAAGVGNLGLQDQREALRWVQKYISSFGGDPTKVTLWGESAGAISASLQMLANGGNTEGLFRGAFLESGSPIPVGDISHGQPYYDAVVSHTGCSGAADTLACLRTVPYAKLKAAINLSPGIFSYQSLDLAWLPRADGVFLTDSPQKLVQAGKVANIPFVSGDCDDEGTLFSLSTLNITTDAQLKTYLKTLWLPSIADADLTKLMTLYPSDITQGSPYGTGILNALTPQSKRIASFQGDAVFQAPRRFFMQARSGKQNMWGFLSKRFKVLPILGSAHFTDIVNSYGGGELEDYLINFVATLNPNGNSVATWPQYTTAAPNLMTFHDDILFPTTITQDTYRKDAMAFLINVTLVNAI
ncbi:carotenoid ester lipase precursor [Mycena floridula]|nr:carotenoid ester lipase precursor [Mycena floridula]